MAIEETLNQFILNMIATRYVSGAGFVILLYDHILTFSDELELVWKAEWTIPKVLFLINRYLIPSMMVIQTYLMSGISTPHFTNDVCHVYLSILLFVGMTSIAISNFLVLLRLWIIWDRNRRIIYGTLAAFILNQIAALVTASIVTKQLQRVAIFSPILGTCYVSEKFGLQDIWIPGVGFPYCVSQLLVFCATFWNAFDRPRDIDLQLTRALYRDGFSYFLVLFVLRIINLTLSIIAPISLLFLAVFFIWCLSNVTVTRLVMNCRRLAKEGKERDDYSLPSGLFSLRSHTRSISSTFGLRSFGVDLKS